LAFATFSASISSSVSSSDSSSEELSSVSMTALASTVLVSSFTEVTVIPPVDDSTLD